MRWLWFVSVIAALVVGSACGGGGSDKPARNFNDIDFETIAQITSDAGLSFPVVLQSDAPMSNGQAARLFSDPKKWMDDFDNWGRTGGRIITYGSLNGQGAAVQVQVEAYKTAGGAKKAMSAVREFTLSPEALATYATQGFAGAKVEKIDAKKIGEESAAYRLDVTAQGNPYATLVILFRRGPVIAQASVGTAPDQTSTSDVEAVASQMDAHIQAILSGTPEPTVPQSN